MDDPSHAPPPVPKLLDYAPPAVQNDVLEIALNQRRLMFCLVAQFGWFSFIFLDQTRPHLINTILTMLMLVPLVLGAVFAFRLSLAIYDVGWGIAMGILTLVPFAGLVVLLRINARANRILHYKGIRVGWFGANVSQVPSADSRLD